MSASRFVASDSINVAGLAVGPTGDLWVAFMPSSGDADWAWALARYDGTTWSVLDPIDGLTEPGNLLWPGAFVIAPDGSVWLTTDRGVARFDGQLWISPFGSNTFGALSFGPDGTLWAVGPSGVLRLPAAGGA